MDDFDKPEEPWEKAETDRLIKALKEHPFQGSLQGAQPGQIPTGPQPVCLFPGGPVIGWV